MPSRSPLASRPYLAPLGSGVSRVSPARARRRGVEVGLVPGVVDDHQRAVRCDVVQPGQRRLGKPVLQQRVPAVEVGALGPRVATSRAYRGDDLVGVADGDRPDVDHAVRQHDRLHQRMAVCLNESGHHAAVTDIDGLRCRARSGSRRRLGRRPRRCGRPTPPAPRRWAGLVDGQDGSGDDEICGRHAADSRWGGLTCGFTSPKNSSKKFRARVDFGRLPFDVSTRARWTRPFTTDRRRHHNVALHADHAVHPRGREGLRGSRTSTSTRSSRRWAATTRSSSRPASCWPVRA